MSMILLAIPTIGKMLISGGLIILALWAVFTGPDDEDDEIQPFDFEDDDTTGFYR
jgi:hypothetical protein